MIFELCAEGDDRFWALYDQSFPVEEREPRSVILAAARAGVGRIARVSRAGETVGLASAHLLKDPAALFLVYLAVDPALRGQGIGKQLFDFIAGDSAQVIWEVDVPERASDEAERQKRERRIRFFRKVGGEVLEHPYVQPPLGQDLPPVPMLLMARPVPADVGALVHAIYFEKYGAQNGIPGRDAEVAPVRRFLRFFVIAFFFNLCLLRYAFARLGKLFIFDRERRRIAVSRLQGRILAWGMARLGATFIKLGQVMSTRLDLFDKELIDELRALQDRLPPFPTVEARRIVEEELGGSVEDHFAEFGEPVAAASVAQVHRARLRDGTEVAVKILRPDVRARVEADAAILLWNARVIALLPSMRMSDPRGHLEHFVQGIIDQTDLSLEAANYEIFRKNFASFEGVRFPRVYSAQSKKRVLTMEFLRGTKVDELGPGNHRIVIDRLRNALLKMLFEDGFVHADLHPGNFVITAEQEIAVFDVGLVKGLSEESLIQYIDWNRCLAMGTSDDYVRHLRQYYLRDREEVDWPALTRDVDAFAKGFRGKTAAEIEIGELIHRALIIGRKYGLRPVTEMALIMVAVITCEGVGKQLDPTSNSLEHIAAYLMPILQRRGMLTNPAASPAATPQSQTQS